MAKEPSTLDEIDKEIERLKGLREEAERQEVLKKVQVNYERAVEIYGRLINDLRELEVIGYLPPKIAAALTDGTGKFNPGMYVKRPKAPR